MLPKSLNFISRLPKTSFTILMLSQLAVQRKFVAQASSVSSMPSELKPVYPCEIKREVTPMLSAFKTFESRLYLYTSLSDAEIAALEAEKVRLKEASETAPPSVAKVLALLIHEASSALKLKNYQDGLDSIAKVIALLQENTAELSSCLVAETISPDQALAVAYNLKAKLAAGASNLWLSKDSYDAAIAHAEKVPAPLTVEQKAAFNENIAVLYGSRGALLNDMGKHVEACVDHEKAMELGGGAHAVLLANYGRGLHQLAFMEAANNLTAGEVQAIKEQSIRIELQTNSELQKRIALAKKQFIDALAISPLNETTLRYFANLDLDMGSKDDALEKINEAISIASAPNPMSFFTRALYYWQQGDTVAMLADLKQTQKLLAMHSDVPRYQQWAEGLEYVVVPYLTKYDYESSCVSLMPYDDVLFTAYNELIYNEWKERNADLEVKLAGQVVLNPAEFGIVTHYEYAMLSNLAYRTDKWKLPPNWAILTIPDKSMRTNGYFAVAFINHKTRDVVIAHRGTSNKDDVLTDAKFAAGRTNITFMNAYRFNEQVRNELAEKAWTHYRISHTGHSLGGLHAEVAAYHDSIREGATEVVEAVTFECPGSEELLRNTLHSHMVSEPKIDRSKVRLTTYLAEPNLFNTARQHLNDAKKVGAFLHIRPMHNPPWWKKLVPSDAGQTWVTHSMDDIVNCLAQIGHKVEVIHDWPFGVATDYSDYAKYALKTGGSLTSREEQYFKRYIQHLILSEAKPYELDISLFSDEVQKFLRETCQDEKHAVSTSDASGLPYSRCKLIGNTLFTIGSTLKAAEIEQHLFKNYRYFAPTCRSLYKLESVPTTTGTSTVGVATVLAPAVAAGAGLAAPLPAADKSAEAAILH